MEFCCCEELLRIRPRKGDALIYFPAEADGQPASQVQPEIHRVGPEFSSWHGSA
jgi:hypothetical protein